MPATACGHIKTNGKRCSPRPSASLPSATSTPVSTAATKTWSKTAPALAIPNANPTTSASGTTKSGLDLAVRDPAIRENTNQNAKKQPWVSESRSNRKL